MPTCLPWSAGGRRRLESLTVVNRGRGSLHTGRSSSSSRRVTLWRVETVTGDGGRNRPASSSRGRRLAESSDLGMAGWGWAVEETQQTPRRGDRGKRAGNRLDWRGTKRRSQIWRWSGGECRCVKPANCDAWVAWRGSDGAVIVECPRAAEKDVPCECPSDGLLGLDPAKNCTNRR